MSKRIKIAIDGRIATLVSPHDRDALLKFWSYSVPGFQFMQHRFKGWDGRIKLLQRGRVPVGLFYATRKEIKQAGIRFKVTGAPLPIRLQKKPPEPKANDKYQYQAECVQKMIEAAQKYGGGLILNATGTGKTRIAAMLFECIRGKCIFVVDQLDLLEQAQKAIEEYLGEKVGYVGNSKFLPQRVTIATVQTLHKHEQDPRFREWTRDVDVVVVDEIHVQMSKRNFDVVKDIRPRACFGLTATLQMKQKPVRVRAWAIAGPVIYEYPLVKGMESGVLSKGIVLRVLHDLPRQDPFDDDSELPDGYMKQYERMILDDSERNSILSRLARYGYKQGYYVIVIVERIRHLKKLSKRLEDVPHRLVFGEKKVEDRIKSKVKFEKGKIRLLIVNKVFKKGVDIKRVDVIIDGAALKSKNDALQKFGRGVRTHQDKTGLIYFDLADVDPYSERIKQWNKGKKHKMREHGLHVASKSRKSAFKQAGIRIGEFKWGVDGEAKEAYQQAKKLLAKEMQRGK